MEPSLYYLPHKNPCSVSQRSANKRSKKLILKIDILEAVVGLPSKLFYNTGILASILSYFSNDFQRGKPPQSAIECSNGI
ncbi:MAG: N-6 DNA methylase [Desulfamplus sp.]|nr:N-6 DNA methylase [Desulfamplus sp.]